MQYTLLDDEEKLREAIYKNNSIKDVLVFLGYKNGSPGNYKTFYKYVEKYKIDIFHIKSTDKSRGRKQKLSLEDIINNKQKINNSADLKKKLYKAGLKQPICELCGQDENWNGMKISLILDHINGDNKNNKLENLRIVCPNCDAGLPTYKGKNITNRINRSKD